jgi:hypothetical protein
MLDDLVQETTNAPGTATEIVLAGAPANRRTFVQAFGNNAQCFYFMTDGAQTEVGIGTTIAGTPNKLARTMVLRNTADTTARLNFTGTTLIYNSLPAARTPIIGNDGRLLPSVLPQALMSQVFSAPAVSVPHNTSFNMPWNQMGVNTLGGQPGANPAYALVPPTSGLYRATLCITFGNSTAGQRLAEIIVGGTTRARVRSPSATGIVDLVCAWEGPMEAGQNVQAFVYQDSGGPLACGGTTQSSFTLTRL